MDLRKLHYFFAVVEHGNLSGAAQALRISQPTLTRHMQSFEAEFGTPLFVRSGRGMTPTDAGWRLHQGLQGIEKQVHALQSDIAETLNEPSGEVALGIPPSPRTLIGVELIKRFAKLYPRVTVRVVEETSGQLCDLVAGGTLEMAITNLFEPMRGINAKPLGREPLMLVGPREARLSQRKIIPIAKLVNVPLILTTQPNSLRLKIEAELGAIGARPDLRVEANTLPLMTDLVIAGLGYTVLPGSGIVALLRKKIVSASPIADCHLTWIVATPKTRRLSVAAQKLFEMLFVIGKEKIADGTWQSASSSSR